METRMKGESGVMERERGGKGGESVIQREEMKHS
jgi:hypothetical protein